jgi:hypothetical protein
VGVAALPAQNGERFMKKVFIRIAHGIGQAMACLVKVQVYCAVYINSDGDIIIGWNSDVISARKGI